MSVSNENLFDPKNDYRLTAGYMIVDRLAIKRIKLFYRLKNLLLGIGLTERQANKLLEGGYDAMKRDHEEG